MNGSKFAAWLLATGMLLGFGGALVRCFYPEAIPEKVVKDLLTLAAASIGAAAIIEGQVRRVPSWVAALVILFVCLGIPALLLLL